MNKTTIIFLIGNRDLQISKSHQLTENPIFKAYFIQQQDGEDFIIEKREGTTFTFVQAAADILLHYEELKNDVIFPMIGDTLAHLQLEKPRLVFCATWQKPKPYHQDSFDFARFAEKYFSEKGYECVSEFMETNPNDFAAATDYYTTIFHKHSPKETQLYISNSGGTPTMRAASHFAGIFRGYQYLHIISSKVNGNIQKTFHFQTFAKQEQMILKEIIYSKLHVYDYEGILWLPSILPEIRNLCEDALDLYNLKLGIDEKGGYEQSAIEALNLIYSNMLVCYKKGGYVDTVQRIFRIEEQIGQLLFFRLLKSSGFIQANDRVIDTHNHIRMSFSQFMNHKDRVKFLTYHFSSIFTVRGSEFYFDTNTSLKAVLNGKNFYYFLFKGLNLHPEIYDFWAVPNQNYHYDNKLANLRNKSILGHGFKGISESDLCDALEQDFHTFHAELANLMQIHLSIPIFNIFDEINENIYNLL